MKQLFFDKPMLKEAEQWAENLGRINNSIMRGRGNLAGRLGEIALARHLGVDIEDHKAVSYTHLTLPTSDLV